MPVTVRVPGSLGGGASLPRKRESDIPSESVVVIDDPPPTLGELVAVLDLRVPGLAAALEAGGFTFVVNDEVLLHGASRHPLQDGDRVELLPAIAGG